MDPDNGSSDSSKSVSKQLSDCPNGGTDLKNWADADDRIYPRSQDYLDPVREPLRAPNRPTPQYGPTLFHLPAQAPSSVLHPTKAEVRVHPHGAQNTEFHASFTAAPSTPNIPKLSPLEAPRRAPRLHEPKPTSPGSDFPRASQVAGFLSPSSLRPPGSVPTNELELVPARVWADPEHSIDTLSDAESDNA